MKCSVLVYDWLYKLVAARPSFSGLSFGKETLFSGGSMNHLNSVLIEGRLVRDPLFRTTAKGVALCTFAIATDRFYKQESSMEKETHFFEVESWSQLAEKCKSLGRQGRGVRVVGRLKQGRWTDTDGKAKSRVSIIAEHIEFRPEAKRDVAGSVAANNSYAPNRAFADEPEPAF
jgi:single-strand DNA-binding protein